MLCLCYTVETSNSDFRDKMLPKQLKQPQSSKKFKCRIFHSAWEQSETEGIVYAATAWRYQRIWWCTFDIDGCSLHYDYSPQHIISLWVCFTLSFSILYFQLLEWQTCSSAISQWINVPIVTTCYFLYDTHILEILWKSRVLTRAKVEFAQRVYYGVE